MSIVKKLINKNILMYLKIKKIDDLKFSQSDLNKLVEEQKQEISALKSNIEAEIKNVKEVTGSKIASDELKAELSELNKQHDELKLNAKKLNEQKSELEKRLEQIQNDLENLDNSNKQLENELKIRQENEEKQKILLETMTNEKEIEREKFKEHISDLNQELDSLKRAKNDLNSKLEQVSLNLSESHTNELNELRKNIHELEIAKKSLILELEEKTKSEESSQFYITQLKQEVDSLNLVKDDLSEKLQNAYSNLDESHKNQLASLNGHIDELKKNCQNLVEEKTSLDKQFQDEKEFLKTKVEEITAELKFLKSKIIKIS